MVIRKNLYRSGIESRVRAPVLPKNLRRVTPHMVRLTKLSHRVCLPLGLDPRTGIGLCKPWHPTRMYWVSKIIGLRHYSKVSYTMQRPKCGYYGNLGTMGYPKVRKDYGIRGLVRSPGMLCVNSFSTIKAPAGGRIKELTELNRRNKQLVNNNLIHVVADPHTLVLAYEIIKSNPGNMTEGVDTQTLDGADLSWIKKVSSSLLAGKFEFGAARRVYIPKKDKNKKRLLTISNPRDKVVQQAMYLVLNAIYEPSFLDSSHGSRPNRGNHSALKAIKLKFHGVKWCVEADIDNNFPSISHKVLLRILRKRISCDKFLALIKRSIKVGYVNDGTFYPSNMGLLQGNITSPILNNVYLHELDVFMGELSKNFASGKYRRKNPVFRRIQYLMEGESNRSELKKLRRKFWKIQSKDPVDPNFKRLYYIRYVDDFVIGIVGSREDTISIKNIVKGFLKAELKLNLSDEKTLITHFSKTPITFLGILIKGNWETDKRIKLVKRGGVTRKISLTGRTVLMAPIKDLFLKATVAGFFKRKHGKFIPTKVGWLINLDHADILKYYNSVSRGILNFYSFANNRKSLGSLVHGLKFSCARTLALKYKLRFASKVFRRFGGRLKCPKTGLKFYLPDSFGAIHHFMIHRPIPDKALFTR